MGLFDFFKKKQVKESPISKQAVFKEPPISPAAAPVTPPHTVPCGIALAYHVCVDESNVDSFKKKEYIAFDVETTGLDSIHDRIIEIGAVQFVDGQPIKRFSSLVNPEKSIPASATSINHITNKMVATAPTEQEISADLIEFLGDAINGETVMCAHNASFDFKFLCAMLSRLGYNASFQYIDTLTLSRTHIKGLANYKQSTLEQYFGLVNENAHRAVSDAENCGKILYQILCHAVFLPESSRPAYLDISDEAFNKGYQCWSRGEDARKNGDVEKALQLYAKAKAIGYKYPVLYRSYAMAFRKIKDYEKEILILTEAIEYLGEANSISIEFIERKERAEELLSTQQKKEAEAQLKAEEKAKKAEERQRKKELQAAKPKKPTGKPIIQCTDDGTEIHEFKSVAAAAESVGVSTRCIRDAATGKQKHAGGYCWKYANSGTD